MIGNFCTLIAKWFYQRISGSDYLLFHYIYCWSLILISAGLSSLAMRGWLTVVCCYYICLYRYIYNYTFSKLIIYFCIFITMYKKTCNYDAFFHLVYDAYFDLFFLLCYCFPPYCWLLWSVNAAYPFHIFHVNLITVSAEFHTESFFSLQGSWEWN